MSNSEHNGTDGTASDECKLRQFERNRFFNGKLMTARDMDAEQDYHASRLDTLTQHVTGEGIVCGLEVEIEPAEGDGDTPTAIVGCGLAYGSDGRPIVVDDDTREEIPADALGGNGVSVFVEQETCKAESVPVPGSEDACKEECDYNRLKEQVDITFESGPPDEQKSVPIDRVDTTPTGSDAFPPDETEGEMFAPTDDVLKELARTFNLRREDDPDDLRYRPCNTADDGAVFVGYFREQDDGTWSPVDSEPRPHVYTNNMLYAGLADHAFDLANPHYTSLEISDLDTGAEVRTENTEDVTLTSSDESVTISANAEERTLDLTGAGGGEGLGPLEAYLREHAIRCTACTFAEVEDQFEQSPGNAATIAGRIARIAREELGGDSPVYEDPEEFVGFVEDLGQEMVELNGELGQLDFVGGREDYERSLRRLVEVSDGGDPIEVSIALLRMCEVADCLSGHCIRFDKFHEVNTLVPSPMTYREIVISPKLEQFDSGASPRFVTREDGTTALRFLHVGLRIAVPTTSFATVAVRQESEGVDVILEAYSHENEQVGEERGRPSPDSDTTLSIETDEDNISYLELRVEEGWAHLTQICVR